MLATFVACFNRGEYLPSMTTIARKRFDCVAPKDWELAVRALLPEQLQDNFLACLSAKEDRAGWDLFVLLQLLMNQRHIVATRDKSKTGESRELTLAFPEFEGARYQDLISSAFQLLHSITYSPCDINQLVRFSRTMSALGHAVLSSFDAKFSTASELVPDQRFPQIVIKSSVLRKLDLGCQQLELVTTSPPKSLGGVNDRLDAIYNHARQSTFAIHNRVRELLDRLASPNSHRTVTDNPSDFFTDSFEWLLKNWNNNGLFPQMCSPSISQWEREQQERDVQIALDLTTMLRRYSIREEENLTLENMVDALQRVEYLAIASNLNDQVHVVRKRIINAVEKALLRPGLVIIQGKPGTGKTVMARWLLRNWKGPTPENPVAIRRWMVRDTMMMDLACMTRSQLDGPNVINDPLAAAMSAKFLTKSSEKGKDWIIFIDNLKAGAGLDEFFTQFESLSHLIENGRFVVTTQDDLGPELIKFIGQSAKASKGKLTCVMIEALDALEVTELIRRVAIIPPSHPWESDVSNFLRADLGYSPMATRIFASLAGVYIGDAMKTEPRRERDVCINLGLRRAYSKVREAQYENPTANTLLQNLHPGALRTIVAVLKFLQTNPDVVLVACMMSLLHPSLTVSRLFFGLENTSTPNDETLLVCCGDRLFRAWDTLRYFGLVSGEIRQKKVEATRIHDPSQERRSLLAMDPAVQLLVRDIYSAALPDAASLIVASITLHIEEPTAHTEISIVKDYFHAAHQLYLNVCELGVLEKIDLADFAFRVARLMPFVFLPREAIKLQLHALELREDLFGSFHEDVAESYVDLGALHSDLDELDQALEYQKLSLEIYQQIVKVNAAYVPFVARGISILANTLEDQGKFSEAFEHYEAARAIFEKCHTDKMNLDVAGMLYNAGNCLCELGQLAEAVTFHEKAIEIKSEIYGGELVEANIISFSELGKISMKRKYYDSALKYYLKVSEISAKLEGEWVRLEGPVSLFHCGQICLELNMHRQAEEFFKKSVDLHTSILQGQIHPDLAKTIAHLGTSKRYQRPPLLRECADEYQKSLIMYIDMRSKKEPFYNSIFEILENLGMIQRELRAFGPALTYFNSALDLAKEHRGTERHADIASVLSEIALNYLCQGKVEEGLEYYSRALEIYEALPVLEEKMIRICVDAASQLRELKNDDSWLADALTFLERAHELLEHFMKVEKVPRENELTAIIFETIGLAHLDASNGIEAEIFLRKSYDVREAMFKLEKKETEKFATCIKNYAAALTFLEKFSESYSMYERALEMRQRIYKEESESDENGDIIVSMARCLHQQGDIEGTKVLVERALEMFQKCGIEDKTAVAKNALVSIDAELKKKRAEKTVETGLSHASPRLSDLKSVCANCGAKNPTKVCGGCKSVGYCSAVCQKSNWAKHKALCSKK